PRDIVDLILLRELVSAEGTPSLAEIAEATRGVFEARAVDARTLNRAPRSWPVAAVAHPHWPSDYARAAADGGVELQLDEAVAVVNGWLAEIAASEKAWIA
ncbi:MAG: hypothetical protein HGA44_04955, partial [Cellulomonadaceae bacterium]|nr:hypothetical protein [Cellulomonadaceae bacterium]